MLVPTTTTTDTTLCALTISPDFGVTDGECEERVTCVETASVSVANDLAACQGVTGAALDAATACEAVTLDCASTSTGSCAAGCTDSGSACTGVSTTLACTYRPGGSYARCTYVDGTYSDGGTGDGVMDTIIILDSCSSRVVPWSVTFDTTLCTLTATDDYGETRGSCADVDSATATCEYVPSEYVEDCTECDGGFQPVTNHSICKHKSNSHPSQLGCQGIDSDILLVITGEECPAGKAVCTKPIPTTT